MSRIYLSAPHMSGLEREFVDEAFRSNWLTTLGPNVEGFEAEFEALIGRPAVALGSGTAALHLALRLAGVGPGDRVLCPTFTFVASANPVRYLGAEPVFLDSERRSWNLDPEALASALAELGGPARPRALVVVHLFGQTADMDPILELCGRHGVAVIEDAAEALGADYRGRPAGALGDYGVYSFNGNKIITTTGGGMLVARERAAVDRARFWSQQARDPGVAYEHSELGYNYRLSNVLAGIGRGQLRVLAERVAARRAIAFRYRDALADLGGFELMPQAPWGLHTNWLSCFLVDDRALGCTRDALIRALASEDIEARPVWKPMHLQPLYAGARRFGGEVAEDLFTRGICLPSSSSLTDEEQGRVVAALRGAVARARGAAA